MTGLLARTGRKILNFIAEFGQIAMLLFSVFRFTPKMFKDRKNVVEQMGVVGADSLPLVIMIGSFTGAIAAIQATSLFAKFNMVAMTRPYMGASIATVVFTELTPVLTALVIAGRVGGAMAAQLGTMKVSEQIDALEMMAINPDRFLAMPRVSATLIMMPILAVFSNVVALIGAYLLMAFTYDLSLFTFFDSVYNYFNIKEIFIGLTKSFAFGGVTALIGCHVGFKTYGGAEGVGNSTVRAFTLTASTILVIDAVFGYIL